MPDKSLRVPADRAKALAVLAAMPNEAYSWFVAWSVTGYPDDLGGFRPESRASIDALRAAAHLWSGDVR